MADIKQVKIGSTTYNIVASSCSGNAATATTASKLSTSSAGTTSQPVYFTNGVPTPISYTIGKSVPSNAVFTDTHYSSKNVVGSSTATSNTTTALTNGNVYLNSVENGSVTSAHKISGSGATTVTTDTSGNILINSTNTTTFAASAITSGTLGVARGGTGATTHTLNAVLTGNDSSAVNNVATASGALYATSANGAAKFGTLPVAQGGTGASSKGTTLLSNLGITAGTDTPATSGTAGTIYIQYASS